MFSQEVTRMHSRKELTDLQKFYHLKSLLGDEAARTIQHIAVSEKGYHSACERLKDRYDRPKYVVNALLDNFMALPCTNVALRKIAGQSNEILCSFNAIDRDGRDCCVVICTFIAGQSGYGNQDSLLPRVQRPR